MKIILVTKEMVTGKGVNAKTMVLIKLLSLANITDGMSEFINVNLAVIKRNTCKI